MTEIQQHEFPRTIGFPVHQDRTERVCPHCSTVKITMHPPGKPGWREWRTSNGTIWKADAPPPCVVREVGEVAAS